jgi:hypothetical protein
VKAESRSPKECSTRPDAIENREDDTGRGPLIFWCCGDGALSTRPNTDAKHHCVNGGRNASLGCPVATSQAGRDVDGHLHPVRSVRPRNPLSCHLSARMRLGRLARSGAYRYPVSISIRLALAQRQRLLASSHADSRPARRDTTTHGLVIPPTSTHPPTTLAPLSRPVHTQRSRIAALSHRARARCAARAS